VYRSTSSFVEVVERADLLVLRTLVHHRRVEQRMVGTIVVSFASDAGRGVLGVVRLVGDRADPVGAAGGVDGAAYVRRFLVPQVRLHLELLHDRRVDAADGDRRDPEQGQRRAGPDQVAHRAVGEHEDRHRHHDRDPGQDLLRR
jgi:hypothetical protein